MPSSLHFPSIRPFASSHTRSANGGYVESLLSNGMAKSADGSTPDAHEAIEVLARRLGLTFRQAEVLHWIAEGKTNQETAMILGCSVNTVKMHLKGIFQRLSLHSRTAAAACAYRAHIHQAGRSSTLP